jgi:uncharacterized membrane protein
MNKKLNILTLISSIIVSVVWFLGASKLPMFQCNPTEFGCVGTGIGIAFIHFIIIPIIFGISGYIFSKEKRFKQAFYSLGISFIVAMVVFLPSFIIGINGNNLKAQQDIENMKANYYMHPEQYKQRPF